MHANTRPYLLSRRLTLAGMALLVALPLVGHAKKGDTSRLRAVIVGGGPNLENNQVAIESNVRYVNRLLPSNIVRTTLFADGNLNNPTVLTDVDLRKVSTPERILRLTLQDRDSQELSPTLYRKPNLGGKIDGATRSRDVSRLFSQLAMEVEREPKQLFLYFTGHGSSDRQGDNNNLYDMWNNEVLSVRDLSKHISRLPNTTPVTIVMVQCHSGSFANLIFEGGDPQADVVDRDIVGYFAATKERPAAGCTSEVNEEEYRDFTSYFFAALTGKDRVGRKVMGADYNKDGRVGMDEAYCYTLIHDRSIDVPVCTSDIFLRRFVTLRDSEVFQTPYSQVIEWATPAQRAALVALSKILGREPGEDRLQLAYRDMVRGVSRTNFVGNDYETLRREYNSARQSARRRLFGRFPNLETEQTRVALEQAKRFLEADGDNETYTKLLKAEEALSKSESEEERREIAESHLMRFVRLGKSVILAHTLRQKGERPLVERFERLIKGEAASPLLPMERRAGEEVSQ